MAFSKMTSVIFEHFFILDIKQTNKLKIIKIETHVLSNQLEQSFFFPSGPITKEESVW